MQWLRCFGYAQSACGERTKHISILEQIHEIQIHCVDNGLGGIGISCSQHIEAFIGICDWNRLPIAELDCYYVQNERENQNRSRNV